METTDYPPSAGGVMHQTGDAVPANGLHVVWAAVAPTASGDEPSIASAVQCMSCGVGELGLLFPFHAGREVIAVPPVSRVPNTVGWMRGLANVRGALVAVIDTAAAFGVRRAGGSPYLLIFGHGENAIGLLIDGLPRLIDLEPTQRLDDLPAVPALLQGCVTAAYVQAGRTWLEVDLAALFENFARHIAIV